MLIDGLSVKPVDLQNINDQIKAQQEASLRVSHQLASLFSANSMWMNSVLQLGIVGFDMALPFKRKFVNKIMGRSGHVPSLLLSANE